MIELNWSDFQALCFDQLHTVFLGHAGSVDTVGTTGKLIIEPNAVNSVPRMALMEIDIRDVDLERRDGVIDKIVEEVARIAGKRKLRHTVEIVNKDPPAECSHQV